MNQKLICIVATLVLAMTPLAALAQGAGITITSPANHSQQSRAITFAGTASPETGLSLTIDGLTYLVPADRSVTEGRGASAVGTTDGSGKFSFAVALDGSDVVVDQTGKRQAVTDGSHSFQVHELYKPDAAESEIITLTIQASGNAAGGTASAPTQTPTATPTASPPAGGAAAVTAQANASKTPDVALVLLVTAALSVGILVVAHRFSPPHR